jgi:hypothetical protein
MSLKRYSGVAGLALLISQALYPCSLIVIGGYTPAAVRQVSGALSGTVIGSGRLDLMGNSHDEERRSITVHGATISVKSRTDTAFFKKGEIKYPRGMKHSGGNVKEWKCGSEVAELKTDQAGNFTITGLETGKHCLDITGPQPENDIECGSYNVVSGKNVCSPLQASFLIDVIPSAPRPR